MKLGLHTGMSLEQRLEEVAPVIDDLVFTISSVYKNRLEATIRHQASCGVGPLRHADTRKTKQSDELKIKGPQEIIGRDGVNLYRFGVHKGGNELLHMIMKCTGTPTPRLQKIYFQPDGEATDISPVNEVFPYDKDLDLSNEEIYMQMRAMLDRESHLNVSGNFKTLDEATLRPVQPEDVPRIRKLYHQFNPPNYELQQIIDGARNPMGTMRNPGKEAIAKWASQGFILEKRKERVGGDASFEDILAQVLAEGESYPTKIRCLANDARNKLFAVLMYTQGGTDAVERNRLFMTKGSMNGKVSSILIEDAQKYVEPDFLENMVRGDLLLTDINDPASPYIGVKTLLEGSKEWLAYHEDSHMTLEAHASAIVRQQGLDIEIPLKNRSAIMAYFGIGMEKRGTAINRQVPSAIRIINRVKTQFYSVMDQMTGSARQIHEKSSAQYEAARSGFAYQRKKMF